MKPCKSCRSEIHAQAKVCPVCQRSQNSFSGWVTWLSGATTLVAFLISASVFLYGASQSAIARNFGADLQVLNLSSHRAMTLFNNAPTDVLLRDVRLSLPGGIELSLIIDRSLSAGEVARVDMAALIRTQIKGAVALLLAPETAGSLVRESHAPPEVINQIRADLDLGIYAFDEEAGPFFTVEAINIGGTDHGFFGVEGGDVVTASCQIVLSYQVVQGGSFVRTPPCTALLRYRDAPAGASDGA